MGIGIPVVRVVVVLGRGKWDVGLVMHQVDSVGAKGRRRVKVDPVPGPGGQGSVAGGIGQHGEHLPSQLHVGTVGGDTPLIICVDVHMVS